VKSPLFLTDLVSSCTFFFLIWSRGHSLFWSGPNVDDLFFVGTPPLPGAFFLSSELMEYFRVVSCCTFFFFVRPPYLLLPPLRSEPSFQMRQNYPVGFFSDGDLQLGSPLSTRDNITWSCSLPFWAFLYLVTVLLSFCSAVGAPNASLSTLSLELLPPRRPLHSSCNLGLIALRVCPFSTSPPWSPIREGPSPRHLQRLPAQVLSHFFLFFHSHIKPHCRGPPSMP